MTPETPNYTPPDYESVPNIRLKEFLTEYEEIIQANPAPIGILEYHFEQFIDVGIPRISHADKIRDALRRQGIIEAEQFDIKKSGAIFHVHKFGPWERRVLAAFYWTYLELPFCKDSLTTDFPQRVTLLREALSSHPLANYIHDPKLKNINEDRASVMRLITVIETIPPNNFFVNPAELGLTADQAIEIVRKATKREGHIITDGNGRINIAQFRACLKTLQINSQK